MPSGGGLFIRTIPQDDFIEVQVEDTGKGIPPEDLERIFMPFFTTKKKGIGLGLAVVHKILEQHGSQIYIESKTGVGTKFTIRLAK
jgi:signal transduction histidine kinase